VSDIQASLQQAEQKLRERNYFQVQSLCQSVLRREPDNAEAFFLLGAAAWQQGAMPQAIEHFKAAAERDPGNGKYPMRMAAALLYTGALPEARAAADQAAALNPADALTLDSLSVIYAQVGAFDRSLAFARRAVALSPEHPGMQFNLGWAAQYAGDLAAAEAAYRKAIALKPDFERAYLALVEITRQTPQKNFIPQLERLFHKAEGSPERILALGHALAKTWEDFGDFEAALDWLEAAKAPRRAQIRYSPEADAAMFAAAAETWRIGERPSTVGFMEARPIFVIGMPRTGTTLVDRILSNHPQVASAGELKTFPLLVKRATKTQSRRLADGATLLKARELDFHALGLEYAATAHLTAGPSPRFVDKLPFNFLYAGLILRALPEARIVCLRRDPMDSVLSNFRQAFGVQSDFHDYTLSLEDIAHYQAGFDRLMGHWRQALPRDRFTEVKYEDLIADQEGETRRLLEFCGLDWDPACLDFQDNAAGVATASAAQVRQPLHAGSVGRWRRWGDRMRPAEAILKKAAGLKVRAPS
jgi:tetratricopeptide (TPR) repeat protein